MQKRPPTLGLLAVLFLFAFPLTAQADGDVEVATRMSEPTSVAEVSFRNFCNEWMKKLSDREVRNHSLAQPTSKEERLTLRYTGYGKAPRKCEVRATGVPGQPFVGHLVYDELEYQKAAATPSELAMQSPAVYARTEVMEIFRYDGKKWVY